MRINFAVLALNFCLLIQFGRASLSREAFRELRKLPSSQTSAKVAEKYRARFPCILK